MYMQASFSIIFKRVYCKAATLFSTYLPYFCLFICLLLKVHLLLLLVNDELFAIAQMMFLSFVLLLLTTIANVSLAQQTYPCAISTIGWYIGMMDSAGRFGYLSSYMLSTIGEGPITVTTVGNGNIPVCTGYPAWYFYGSNEENVNPGVLRLGNGMIHCYLDLMTTLMGHNMTDVMVVIGDSNGQPSYVNNNTLNICSYSYSGINYQLTANAGPCQVPNPKVTFAAGSPIVTPTQPIYYTQDTTNYWTFLLSPPSSLVPGVYPITMAGACKGAVYVNFTLCFQDPACIKAYFNQTSSGTSGSSTLIVNSTNSSSSSLTSPTSPLMIAIYSIAGVLVLVVLICILRTLDCNYFAYSKQATSDDS